MGVRWTGAASKFLTGPGADSHPDPGLLISRAREIAGDLVNQLSLGEIWYGYRRARITDRVEVLATAYNNFPGAEPIVELQLIVDGEPLEEGDEEPPIGIAVAWPTWDIPPPTEGTYSEWPALMTPNIFTLGQGTTDVVFKTRVFQSLDREIFTGATGIYKRFYSNGIQIGNVDWQGRGEEYALTWLMTEGAMVGVGENTAALRAQSKPGADAVLYRGEVKFALFDNRFGVLGAAIETRPGATGDEDFLNIILRFDDGSGDISVILVTRPFDGPFDEPVTTVDSAIIPTGSDTTQPFFFNDSGTTAVGMVKRFAGSSTGTVSDFWRKPFEGDQGDFSRAFFGEITIPSAGGITIEMKEFANYAVMPDHSGGFLLKEHPLLGQEASWPSNTTVTDTVTLATDWKGDTLVRCTLTILKEASVGSFAWSETTGGVLPRTDSGSFSGTNTDVLIEFTGTAIEAFHAVELVSNIGDYSVSLDTDGVPTSGTSNHTSQSKHRIINFLDMRFDLISYAEVELNTTLTKPTLNSVTPTRTMDLTWILKQGASVLNSVSEPQFEQTIWQGGFGADPARPADPEYVPDMWSATIAFFGTDPLVVALLIFRDWQFGRETDNTRIYHGLISPPTANYFALTSLGLPFIDFRTHLASYKGEIGVYLHTTGWRLLDQIDQGDSQLVNALPTGQTLTSSGVFPASAASSLNSELGIVGGLSFQYEIESSNVGNIYVPQRIPNITLV